LENDYGESEVKGGKPGWKMWVIIGLVAVIAIVLAVVLGGKGPPSTSGLSVDDLGVIVNQQGATIQELSAWKAATMEDIANLKSKDNTLQSQISSIVAPKDWTADFNSLMAQWAGVNQTIADAIAGLNITIQRYAMVSGMEEKLSGIYIDISVYGAGSYPVLVSIYGQNLQNDTFAVKPNTGCLIAKRYWSYIYGLAGSNETGYNLTMNAIRCDFVILPTDEWDTMNLIQMKAVGGASVSYAVALVGESWVEAEEEW